MTAKIEQGVRKMADTPTWIKVFLGIISTGIGLGVVVFAAGASNANGTNLVSSHETRLTKVECSVSELDKRLDSTEKAQIAIQKDQQAILTGQGRHEKQLTEYQKLQKYQLEKYDKLQREQSKENKDFQMKMIAEMTKLSGRFDTIEFIEDKKK